MKITKNDNTAHTGQNAQGSQSNDSTISRLYDILNKDPELINAKDSKKETYLSIAIKSKQINIVNFLITSPLIDYSYQDAFGNSYLHLATLIQREEIVHSLLKRNHDNTFLNLRNKDGNTVLHIAYALNNQWIINMLSLHSIDKEVKNIDGLTADMMTVEMIGNPDEAWNINTNSEGEKYNNNNSKNTFISMSEDLNKSLGIQLSQSEDKTNVNIRNLSLSNFNISSAGTQDENKKVVTESQRIKTSGVDDEIDLYNWSQSISVNGNIINTINGNNEKSIVKDKNIPTDEYNIQYGNNIDDDDDFVNMRWSNMTQQKNLATGSKDGAMNKNVVSMSSNVKQESNTYKHLKKSSDLVNTSHSTKPPVVFEDEFVFSSPSIPIIINENGDAVKNPITQDKVPHVQAIKDNSNQNNKNISTSNIGFPLPNWHKEINNEDISVSMNKSTVPKANTSNNANAHTTHIDNSSNALNPKLKEFLSEIYLEKYFINFHENGFDDINLWIEQTKSSIGISDANWKQAGISLPGERAKILLHLQEKAKNFPFTVPKSIYYGFDLDNELNINNIIENDLNVKRWYDWLCGLKVEKYLEHFLRNGYFSLDLLLLQMVSKQPWTDDLLCNEVGIDKIGYRARIMNKLKEEGTSLYNKLKTKVMIIEKNNNNNICDCFIM